MAILSLTTDLGTKDYYLGAFKGLLLSTIQKPFRLVDINYRIGIHDIKMAAFNVQQAFPSFPEGTIHIIHIYTSYNIQSRLLLIKYEGHYFLAPDNGVLSLMANLEELDVWNVDLPDFEDDITIDQKIAQAANYILNERPIGEIGELVTDAVQKITLQPTISNNVIKGVVTYIDIYENVILNVSKARFEEIGKGRPVEIFFNKYVSLIKVSNSYADAAIGEPVCFFNESGMMELAVNMDRMASLYNIRLDDFIKIKFFDHD